MSHVVTVNPRILAMEYAVRGPIPQRAAEMAQAGRSIIPCNIGNPQGLGQRPITFYRQILSLLEDPVNLERLGRAPSDAGTYPADVIEMAGEMAEGSRTGTGAYTESAGFKFVREAVSRFIDARDQLDSEGGLASDPDQVLLTDGASGGAVYVLEALISGPQDGILVPIPQYPLYSASIARCGGVLVGYHPDEESGWTLNRSILERSLGEARSKGVKVKAIVVINPGNPTGALLDVASMKQVVDVAREWDLAIIADEVYQENTYGRPWTSFARVVGNEKIPLFSLHSVSKGFYGECGHRGGYLEIRHSPPVEGTNLTLTEVLLKQASVNLCPNTMGQFLVHLMVTGPRKGTQSEELFRRERKTILQDLEAKATMIRDSFSKMDGMECFGRTGAMYLFPRLSRLPSGVGDFDYCMALLEETGMVTVNGAGFGQAEGTNHLRVAFLPPFELIEKVMPRWVEFHNRYV
ncbi:MAG: aminotransferase class I/II-fold pyridoxal phosphate-dependent enzyme [Thermoanaerobaculales bacterium]|nr:aminotransferase class I/II-fold pyridoxal phosphate-dependent enzyme [Thermoanaerobaculales bacterium]